MTTTSPQIKKCIPCVTHRRHPKCVARAASNIPLAGRVAGTPWQHAQELTIDQYPWYKQGKKQATTLRVLYDASALYVQFQCEDVHIFAETTKLNGSVCLDSCVEFFASPHPDRQPHYFNFESNACGTLLLGWGPEMRDRRPITSELAGEITIVTSVPGPTKQESPTDNGWWLAARIPFATIAKLSGEEIKVGPGTVWRCNAFRCGGKTDDQFAAWAWIDNPVPRFHRPDCYGEMRFE